MKSMTGFGSAIATDTTTGIGLKAEISSINKKQFELKLGLSRELSMYEIPLIGKFFEVVTVRSYEYQDETHEVEIKAPEVIVENDDT